MCKKLHKLSTYKDYRDRPNIFVLLKKLKDEIKKNLAVAKDIPSAKDIFGNSKTALSYNAEKFSQAHIEFVIQLLILYKNFEIYFLARDAEYLYDVAQLLIYLNYLKHNHIHLINVSRATSLADKSV